MVFKLCKCGSSALSLSCLTWCSVAVVRQHLGLELPWLVRGSPVESSVASSIPSSLPHRPLPGVISTHSPQRITAAVPACRAKALGKELCSQAPGGIFLPAETFCLGCALIFRTHDPELFPVISEGLFIISGEELLPRKKWKGEEMFWAGGWSR